MGANVHNRPLIAGQNVDQLRVEEGDVPRFVGPGDFGVHKILQASVGIAEGALQIHERRIPALACERPDPKRSGILQGLMEAMLADSRDTFGRYISNQESTYRRLI